MDGDPAICRFFTLVVFNSQRKARRLNFSVDMIDEVCSSRASKFFDEQQVFTGLINVCCKEAFVGGRISALSHLCVCRVQQTK